VCNTNANISIELLPPLGSLRDRPKSTGTAPAFCSRHHQSILFRLIKHSPRANNRNLSFSPSHAGGRGGRGGEGGRVLASFPSGHQATSTLIIFCEEQEPTDYHQVSFTPSRSGPVDELARPVTVCGELTKSTNGSATSGLGHSIV
jgi:hypothetical protein